MALVIADASSASHPLFVIVVIRTDHSLQNPSSRHSTDSTHYDVSAPFNPHLHKPAHDDVPAPASPHLPNDYPHRHCSHQHQPDYARQLHASPTPDDYTTPLPPGQLRLLMSRPHKSTLRLNVSERAGTHPRREQGCKDRLIRGPRVFE